MNARSVLFQFVGFVWFINLVAKGNPSLYGRGGIATFSFLKNCANIFKKLELQQRNLTRLCIIYEL